MNITINQKIGNNIITTNTFTYNTDVTMTITDEYEVIADTHRIEVAFLVYGTRYINTLEDITNYQGRIYKPSKLYDPLVDAEVDLPYQVSLQNDYIDNVTFDINYVSGEESHSIYLNRYNVVDGQNIYINRLTADTRFGDSQITFTKISNGNVKYRVLALPEVVIENDNPNITDIYIDNHKLELDTPYVVNYDLSRFDANTNIRYVVSSNSKYVYLDINSNKTVIDEFKTKRISAIKVYKQVTSAIDYHFYVKISYNDGSYSIGEIPYTYDNFYYLDDTSPVVLHYNNIDYNLAWNDTITFPTTLNFDVTLTPAYELIQYKVSLYYNNVEESYTDFTNITSFRFTETEDEFADKVITLYFLDYGGITRSISTTINVPEGKVFRGLILNKKLYNIVDKEYIVNIDNNAKFEIIYNDEDTPITVGGLLRGDINENYYLLNLKEMKRLLTSLKIQNDDTGAKYSSLKYIKALGYEGFVPLFKVLGSLPVPITRQVSAVSTINYDAEGYQVESNDLQLYLDEFTIDMYYDDFRDHSPYTLYKIYLPFADEVTIDDTYIHSRLSVYTRFNMDSATLTYVIRADGKTINTIRVNPCINIDYRYSTNSTFDEIRTLSNSVLSVVGGISAVASGNIGGLVNVGNNVISGIEYAMRDKTKVVDDVEGGDNMLRDLTPKLAIYRSVCDLHPSINGRVLEEFKELSDLKGITFVNNPRINIPNATMEEVDMIKQYLKNGIIL